MRARALRELRALCGEQFFSAVSASSREPFAGRLESASHAERGEIEIQNCFLFLPVGAVESSQAHDLPHDLGIKAVALRFGIDFPDIRGQRRFLFFEPLDTLDERFQLVLREVLGHVPRTLFKGADPTPRGSARAMRAFSRGCGFFALLQTSLFVPASFRSGSAPSIRTASCRRRFPATRPYSEQFLFPLPPRGTNRRDNCGKSRRGSSDRCCARRCACEDAAPDVGRPLPRFRSAWFRSSPSSRVHNHSRSGIPHIDRMDRMGETLWPTHAPGYYPYSDQARERRCGWSIQPP